MLLAFAAAWCRVEARLARRNPRRGIVDSMHRFTAAVGLDAFSDSEKGRLTLLIYDASSVYDELAEPVDALFPIEQRLFHRVLPQAPACLLVGACGAGREAIALTRRGLRVHAFDPAPALVAAIRRRLGQDAPVEELTYEALNAAVLDGASTAPELARQRFDAVVLGCGSLSHVLERREQQRLFQTLSVLCPQGPWIASFLWSAQELAQPVWIGRAARWGKRIGRLLGRLRGVSHTTGHHLSYHAERGFAYTYTQREVEQLADEVGRRVVWERDGERPSLYATFVHPAGFVHPPAR